MIVFFMFYLVFVLSIAFRMSHKMSRNNAESEIETLPPVFEFSFFLLERDNELKF